MADISENLRTFLLSDSAISRKTARVVQDALPQGKAGPFIYYSLTGTTQERCLGETTNTPFSYVFAVECIGDTRDDAQALADLVRAKCESAACGGTFGTQTVSNVFCEEQSDDYAPKAVDPNEGERIAVLQVEVYP